VIAYIAKRIFFIVLGYFAGLAAGAAALPGFLLLISTFYPESQLWQFLGLGPIAVIVAPVVLFTIMWIVMVLTFIPAAVLNAITEIFGWRQLWLHLLIALSLAAIAGLMLVPDWFSHMTSNSWLITLAIALSALVGGIVFWAIAGRLAGFRHGEVSAQPQPS
jgi:hypothetical protein